MSEIKYGFEPFYGNDAKILILGSFPSVKSRKVEFYYGNRQNKFWHVLSEFFAETEPVTVNDKKSFLLRNKIALWDVVAECKIVGSQDSTIKNFKVADIQNLLQKIEVRLIILNGGKAEAIFMKYFPKISVPCIKLPSTSPANTRFSKEEWFSGLSRVFERG